VDKETFLTSSWDLSVKLWDDQSNGPISNMMGHSDLVTQVKWNVLNKDVFGSVAQDSNLRIWDRRTTQTSVAIVHCGVSLLCLDFNSKNEHLLATGGDDSLLQVYDIRNLKDPIFKQKLGLGHPIRRVEYSPHHEHKIAASSDCGNVLIVYTNNNTHNVVYNSQYIVRGLTWSISSDVLAIGNGKRFKILNVASL